ncbi:heat shock protein Hsp20 domain-containing protein [Tieghemostelium lacteum]|uniref:Heat shock protein Hsp20 domain-containing protein n=1 Tax=Tieghemostelium lacteum TaxID=361077 RepID=A0A151ZSA5_TIELA|nr:heat shock protein Hsp20 domain-containing protein [Tieghemostelium lacteum]|eukprot:KYQ96822.1 heat shock protein Hsp20 domain-containing protein [Tieghemostelium lacteum]
MTIYKKIKNKVKVSVLLTFLSDITEYLDIDSGDVNQLVYNNRVVDGSFIKNVKNNVEIYHCISQPASELELKMGSFDDFTENLKELCLYLNHRISIENISKTLIANHCPIHTVLIYHEWVTNKLPLTDLNYLTKIKSLTSLTIQMMSLDVIDLNQLILSTTLTDLVLIDMDLLEHPSITMDDIITTLGKNQTITNINCNFINEKLRSSTLIQCLNTNKILRNIKMSFYDITGLGSDDVLIENTTLKFILLKIGRDPIASNILFNLWSGKSGLEKIIFNRFKLENIDGLYQFHLGAKLTVLEIPYKNNLEEIEFLLGLDAIREITFDGSQPAPIRQTYEPIITSLLLTKNLTSVKLSYNVDCRLDFSDLLRFLKCNHPSIEIFWVDYLDRFNLSLLTEALCTNNTLKTLRIQEISNGYYQSLTLEFLDSLSQILSRNQSLQVLSLPIFPNNQETVPIPNELLQSVKEALKINNNNMLSLRYPINYLISEMLLEYFIT